MIGKKRLRVLIAKLESALQASSLSNAVFEDIGAGQVKGRSICIPDTGVTDFIRARVKNHHRSWIATPIEAVIAELKPHAEYPPLKHSRS